MRESVRSTFAACCRICVNDQCDESHAKQLVVREALGAGLPFAGVGCAIDRYVLGRIAEARRGEPFDAASLTEDYELGLAVAELGVSTAFLRIPAARGEPPVAVRALFPGNFSAAVRQKARWMTGIALAGWDRTGWGGLGQIGDHWMRMRDRRAILALPVLATAYAALILAGVMAVIHHLSGIPGPAISPGLLLLLTINLALMGWRLAMRALFVGQAYGWRQALWSIPRVLVADVIALCAAPRAILMYLRLLRGRPPVWHKTDHEFPSAAERALL